MNKDAVKKWAEALAGTEYAEGGPGPGFMRTSDGWSREGVLTDVYRKEFGGEWVESKCYCPDLARFFIPHFEFIPKGTVPYPDGSRTNFAYLPSDEAIKWLNLICRSTDYRLIPERNPRPGISRDVRGRVVECVRYGSVWELKNDPHIDHCQKCEGNNFFVAILEPQMTFAETAEKIRKLYPDLWG